MALTWTQHATETGYQVIKATVNGGVAGTAIITKNDGSILIPVTNETSFTGVDQQYLSSNTLYVTIDDTVTDYADYFLNNPYTMMHQRSNPVIEEVEVEGDLVVNGATQVEVGNSVVVREKVTPHLHTDGKAYINHTTMNGGSTQLDHKVDDFIAVYKNGEEDSNWFRSSLGLTTAYGNYRMEILEKDFDPTATYTVTYIALNDGQSANLTEVNVTYDKSLKSAHDSQVSKLSDTVTDVSILKRQMLETLVRLDALEGGV